MANFRNFVFTQGDVLMIPTQVSYSRPAPRGAAPPNKMPGN